MTEDDDTRRRLRADLDAAIGPTPIAPDRMQALSARYAASRRRNAFGAAAASITVVAAIATAAIAIAAAPGGSGHQVDNKLAIPATQAPPSSIVASTVPTSPAPATPTAPTAPSASLSSSDLGSPVPPAATPSRTAKSAPPTQPLLQGTVVDETGRPLPAIYVTGFDGVTRTDTHGRFIAPTASGRHGGCLLFSSQPLATPQSGPPTAGDFSWQQWSAPSGDCSAEVTADIRVTMHPGADVYGTVRDSSGVGVPRITVFSTVGANGRVFLSSSCCGASFAAVTDNNGHYRIYGQQPGATMLALRQPWYIGGGGGLGYPATVGSGTPTDLTDSASPSASPPATSPST